MFYMSASRDGIKAAKEAISAQKLGRKDWIFFHECPGALRRWATADAKKRGYRVVFSEPHIKFSVNLAKAMKREAEESARFWDDWINSPG